MMLSICSLRQGVRGLGSSGGWVRGRLTRLRRSRPWARRRRRHSQTSLLLRSIDVRRDQKCCSRIWWLLREDVRAGGCLFARVSNRQSSHVRNSFLGRASAAGPVRTVKSWPLKCSLMSTQTCPPSRPPWQRRRGRRGRTLRPRTMNSGP